MKEKTLERKLCEKIKQMGGTAIKFWSVSYTGLPDRIVLMPRAKIYFAEIKTTGKKPKAHQDVTHKFLRGLGFMVYVIDDNESLQQFLGLVKQNVFN